MTPRDGKEKDWRRNPRPSKPRAARPPSFKCLKCGYRIDVHGQVDGRLKCPSESEARERWGR